MDAERDDAADLRDRAADSRERDAQARRARAAARDDRASVRDRRSRGDADDADSGFPDRFLSGRDVDASTGDRADALADQRDAGEDRRHARADRQDAAAARARATEAEAAAADEITLLRQALAGPLVIGQAQGLLMARRGIGAGAAFQLLLREAQDSRVELHEAARSLVHDAEQTPAARPRDGASGGTNPR